MKRGRVARIQFPPRSGTDARQKRRRQQHDFHVVEVPWPRLLGFVILTLLVCVHEVFAPAVAVRITCYILTYESCPHPTHH
ncbi:MAG: hypothetical protein HY047_07475 [Acidobacteria bacterium]|nr:hypothetical protein [Acidobacteriota bacterium]